MELGLNLGDAYSTHGDLTRYLFADAACCWENMIYRRFGKVRREVVVRCQSVSMLDISKVLASGDISVDKLLCHPLYQIDTHVPVE